MLGEKIKKLRKKKGITMKELGSMVGVAESTISLYENSKRTPDYDTLLKIAKCFGVTSSDLLGDSDSFILKQKDLVIELREVITEGCLRGFLSDEVVDASKNLNDEEFVYALSTIASRIECNKETNELNIFFFYDSQSGSTTVDNKKLNSNEQKYISYEPRDEEFLNKYYALDEHGKEVINAIIEIEYSRIRHLNRSKEEARISPLARDKKRNSEQCVCDEDDEPRQLPLYEYPAAAGRGVFSGVGEYDIVNVPKEVPMSASFGVKIRGRSMEPKIQDDAIVWVRQQPDVDDGDICIFTINDEGFCKLKRGNRFVSINPSYSDVEYGLNDNVRISGKVVYIENPESIER